MLFVIILSCLMHFSWVCSLLGNAKTASAPAKTSHEVRSAPEPSQFSQESCPTCGSCPMPGVRTTALKPCPRYLADVYGQAPSREQHARQHPSLPVKSSIIPLRKALSLTQMPGWKNLTLSHPGAVKCVKKSTKPTSDPS